MKKWVKIFLGISYFAAMSAFMFIGKDLEWGIWYKWVTGIAFGFFTFFVFALTKIKTVPPQSSAVPKR